MFRRSLLQPTFLCTLLAATAAAQTLPATGDFGELSPQQTLQKVPNDTILVKGAQPSASDRVTPMPEEGGVVKNVYKNRYLGLSYPLPSDWEESFKGPPPSDRGTYVLAYLLPSSTFQGPIKGTVMFSAQDMFFSLTPVSNAKELIAYRQEHLEPYYESEKAPAEMTIAGHTFARFDYTSKVANLHWVILATQIRCHAVQFVFSSQDVKLIQRLISDMDGITLPADAGAAAGGGGGDWPHCVAGYARPENITNRVEPVLNDRRFNQIPVRIIIDKRGRVKYAHVISAFPDQSRIITDALMQWSFKPYIVDGNPAEVETGIMFGAATQPAKPALPMTSAHAIKTARD